MKSSLKVNNGSLRKMGFTKIGGKWVSKDGDQGGSSSGVHAGEGAGTSVGNQGERIISMYPFERFMVNRMDSFAKNQRNLHEFCATNFQNFDGRFQSMDTRFHNLDEQIKVVQNKLFELHYGKED